MDIDSYMGKPNYVSIMSVSLFLQSTVMYVCQSEQHSMMSVIVTDSVYLIWGSTYWYPRALCIE